MPIQQFPKRIETEQLLLRRYATTDAAGMLELVSENRERLVREFKEQARLQTVTEAECFIGNKLELWNGNKAFCYGIWNGEGTQLGQIQLKNIEWEVPAGELGYFIGERWQRKGYAGEAIRALTRRAFDECGFERLFVRILISNEASLRLARKLGFEAEGLHRKAFRCGYGQLHDVQYFSLIHS